jgi:hypothetical protein
MDIGSTCTDTYSTRFKPNDEIKITSCSSLTDVGTSMVPIENNLHFIANIKSFSSSDIPNWKS